MLRDLNIRNMLLIDRLDLDFQPGLNVLTGETGAGKSILLDSLGFVLGWRGRADLVRKGADQGEVTAVFDLAANHPAHSVLTNAGLPDDDTLILRRTNSPDGRKTAYVNDRRCSGEILRQLSDCLVEIHGQHDDRGLLNPRGHRDLLDQFASLDLAPLRAAWREKQAITTELSTAQSALAAAEKDAEYLRHALAELTELSPQPGEDAALDAQRRLMQGAEKIRTDIARAAEALGPQAAEGAMTDAHRWLEDTSAAAEGRLDEPLAALARAMSELADAQTGIEACLDALEFNPIDLELTEERLFAIRKLARKHDTLPDELPDLADDIAAKVTAIDTGSDTIAEIQARLDKVNKTYTDLAAKISAERAKAGRALSQAMAAELPPLKLERAEFVVDILAADAGPTGTDTVQFMVTTNPGSPAGAIDKIASGGELSRFLLALKVCLTAGTTGLTMIFDEIDRGVGGATADAVGRKLADVATSAQVLVVTHSPQVAAKGAHQWRVSKAVVAGETRSTVEKMEHDARTDEIARMLAGDHITDEARAAARALLAG